MRKAWLREVVNSLRARNQIGFPATMNTDAPSGFSRMAYRSAYVAIYLREAGQFALNRLEGTTSRAHTAPEQGAAQHAKVGYCACCTRATCVAIPPMYTLSAFEWLKYRGAALWEAHGPRAPRQFAACSYANTYEQ